MMKILKRSKKNLVTIEGTLNINVVYLIDVKNYYKYVENNITLPVDFGNLHIQGHN